MTSRVRTRLGGAFATTVGVGLAVALVARARFGRRIETLRDDLLDPASGPSGVVDHDALDDLPAPVNRYLRTAIPDGHPHVQTARLTQRGDFRLGGASAPWKSLRATQWYSTSPPGFVWDARIDLLPALPVRVVDAYEHRAGRLEARLLSTVPLARVAPGPALNEAELQRYLAEAVWFPTALHPSAGVRWAPIDGHAARATLTDGPVRAELDFHFGDDGLVERVHTDCRYREVDGVSVATPWTGTFTDYRERDGLLVPHEAAVEWSLPDGDLPYWRARIEAFEYQYD